MQLPDNLQHFSKPTLVLIGDFGKTKFYLAEEIEINELREVEAPAPAHSDPESSVVVGAGRHAKSDSATDEGEDRKHYSKTLAQTLTDLVDDHDIKEIQIIMPAELLRRLESDLSKDIQNLIIKTIEKDLSKTNLVEALERLHQTPEPIK